MKLYSTPPIANKPRLSQNTHPGFALVVTLSLMILLTIIAVGLLSLSSVALRSSSQDKAIATARANARLALMLAIGELQKEAGPDQRISARAEILDSKTATPEVDGVNQPHWTGIWKTGDKPTEAQRAESIGSDKIKSAVWLVSNPNPATKLDPTSYSGNITGAKPDAVQLASKLGVSPYQTNVSVPLVGVRNNPAATQTSGSYAYWVSDEGLKAKVNLKDPTYGVTPSQNFVQNQQHFLTSQAVPINIEGADGNGLLGKDNKMDVRNKPDLAKVTSLQSMGLLPGMDATKLIGTNIQAYSPDATTHSYGVMVDVRKGGTKTDLSTLFEDSTQFKSFLTAQKQPQDGPGDAKLFTVEGDAMGAGNKTSGINFGVRWQQLYNYYSLYKDTIPANGITNTASNFKGINSFSSGNPGTPAPKIDMRAYNYSSVPKPSSAVEDCPGEYYMPRFVGAGIWLYLSSEKVAPPTGKPLPGAGQSYYKLRLYAQPRVVYYNPHNVTLFSPLENATKSKFQLNWNSNIFVGIKWSVKVGSTQIISNQLMFLSEIDSNGKQKAADDLRWSTNLDPAKADLTMPPGQLKVFGLGKKTGPIPGGGMYIFDGKNGHSYLESDAGQSQWGYVTVTPPAGTISKAPEWIGLASDTDSIKIDIPAQSYTSNNGRYSIAMPAADIWPKSASGTLQLGRFFNENSAQKAMSVDFPSIGNIQSTSEGSAFAYFVMRSRGVIQSTTSNGGTATPTPVFASCDGNFSPYPYRYDAPNVTVDFQLSTQNPNESTAIQVIGSAPNLSSFWGMKDVARDGSDRNGFVLADVPRQPLLSLGQFMHMPLRSSMAARQGGEEVDQNSVMMPVGGSLCNPFIPLDKSYTSVPGQGSGKTFVMDDNYMMNDALFDSCFFSSVPPASPDAPYSAVLPKLASGADAFTDDNIQSNKLILPNSRMKFYFKNGKAPQKSKARETNYLPDSQKCASNLLLDGAFNVNSTSVNAWAALISSLSGNTMNYLNNGSYTALNLGNKVPIPRYPSVVSTDGTNPVNTPFGGIHALSPPQVTALAKEIVAEVKARGPFLSMSDFINRRLSTDQTKGLKGALQAAIDNTSINADNIGNIGNTCGDVVNGVNIKGPKPGNKLYLDQLPKSTAVGIPGWLMQQDLVQAFSPIMTVRSDTFVVRGYGEAKNGSVVVARAWCEAVIQRVPDFIDQSDPKLTVGDATPVYEYDKTKNPPVPKAIVNKTNETFGRRFKMVSFRWLNDKEI